MDLFVEKNRERLSKNNLSNKGTLNKLFFYYMYKNELENLQTGLREDLEEFET